VTNKPRYVPGQLAESQVIGTCRFGHKDCAETLHFRPSWDELNALLSRQRADLEEAKEFIEKLARHHRNHGGPAGCEEWSSQAEALLARLRGKG
jgi:hypothetical protein